MVVIRINPFFRHYDKLRACNFTFDGKRPCVFCVWIDTEPIDQKDWLVKHGPLGFILFFRNLEMH